MLPTRISITRRPMRYAAAGLAVLAIGLAFLPGQPDKDSLLSKTAMVIVMLVVAALMYLMALGTTEVECDSQYLYVSVAGHRRALPLTNVDRVTSSGLGQRRTVIVHFRTATETSQTVSFQMWIWGMWGLPNPMQTLKDAVRGAGGQVDGPGED